MKERNNTMKNALKLEKLLDRCNEMDITEQLNWLGDANMPYQAQKEYANLCSKLAALQQERDELKFLLLRCQQINYTADGEGAGAWNINGEFEKEIDAALKGGKK
jgi:7,8-dihydro-6-hydroxymethylpterin-pyrophosphokinase